MHTGELNDVLVLGGGLAGLSAAIQLARSGHEVALLEQKSYPRHKVCGEYLSLEVVPALRSLGVDLYDLRPRVQKKLWLTGPGGQGLRHALPLGGLGLSRYALDHFLAEHARAAGVKLLTGQKVVSVRPGLPLAEVHTQTGACYRARLVFNATGKRSLIDRELSRGFLRKTAPWMAVKQHMSWSACPEDEVQLHNFPEGYCGISQVESGRVNVCYLVRTGALKACGGNVAELERRLLRANPILDRLFAEGVRHWDRPLVISNVSFSRKPPVERGMLMLGDAAGLISPLCGNGMAMAIGSGLLAGAQADPFLRGKKSRAAMERDYRRAWRQRYAQRMRWGRNLQALFGTPGLTDAAFAAIRYFPPILTQIISRTHGTPAYV